MLTVNLEKELIKQNKKVLLPSELLSIKEYERLGDDICDNEILNRVGINTIVREGKARKIHIEFVNKRLSQFDSTRVFHISQIKSLCEKYHLRFLGTNYFKGSIDKNLAFKISNFEVIYDVNLNARNCKIAAPASSFSLEKKPKDPLFFYEVGNGYWYLVHKWGNDLSLIRRTFRILSNSLFTFLSIIFSLSYLIYKNSFLIKHGDSTEVNPNIIGWISIIFLIVYIIVSIIAAIEGDGLSFVKKSNWESSYL